MAVTLLLVSLLTFFLINMIPGVKADLIIKYALTGFDAGTTPEEIKEVSMHYNLDVPLYMQYVNWVGDLLLHGSLGTSYIYNKPVLHLLEVRLPGTLILATASMCIAVVFGMPLGIYSALRKNRAGDRIIRIVTLFGKSMPNFWVGLLLILVFSVTLKLVPVTGYGGIENLILPAVALSIGPLATIIRITRACVLEVLGTDYIRFAVSKGLGTAQIVGRHTLKNAMLPVITVTGYQFGHMIGGTMVVESIFAWPGIGSLLVDAITARDFPLITGCVMTVVALFLLINVFIDVAYTFIDPRIRYG